MAKFKTTLHSIGITTGLLFFTIFEAFVIFNIIQNVLFQPSEVVIESNQYFFTACFYEIWSLLLPFLPALLIASIVMGWLFSKKEISYLRTIIMAVISSIFIFIKGMLVLFSKHTGSSGGYVAHGSYGVHIILYFMAIFWLILYTPLWISTICLIKWIDTPLHYDQNRTFLVRAYSMIFIFLISSIGLFAVHTYLRAQVSSHAIIQSGDVHAAKLFLSTHKTNQNISPYDKPLRLAIQSGNMKMVQLLINQGEDINTPFDTNPLYAMTPLDVAFSTYPNPNSVDIIKLLVQKGARVDHSDWLKPKPEEGRYVDSYFSYAIQLRSQELAEFLLPYCKSDILTAAPLLIACQSNKIELVKWLIQNGANVNVQHPETGMSPLIIATDYMYIPIVKLLMQHGANPKLPDKNGRTALETAKSNGYPELIRILEKS